MSRPFPLIDIGPFTRPGTSEAARRDVIAAVEQACRATGFLAVTGHGVPRAVTDALVRAAYAFFDLPLEEKLRVRRPAPEQNRGYIPPGDETLARLRGADSPPDLKELFAIGPFDLPDDPYFTGPAAYPSFAPNRWPERPASLAPALRLYWRAMEGLAGTLCRIFALALELPERFFAAKVDRHISQLRLMHYPAQATAPLPGQLRAGEHADLGMMTLIHSDNDVGGLQLKDRDGSWIDAPVIGDAFMVNLGDLMMRWTNDRWVSTPHRVVNPPHVADARSRRLSIGMFWIPNYDAEIACIESCRDGASVKYAPTTVAAYRTERFARTAGSAPAY
ncbi:MAG TPA: 2-oxoglutarate and iron-dependent oxygenase domain-containing protein [Candidatus Sulfotelmatobacter sp.]|nr:2-oxoglutarate and iron-dependent oxygenase domain-containing protein [Candidatus Sulfotelmatobacter sp.]